MIYLAQKAKALERNFKNKCSYICTNAEIHALPPVDFNLLRNPILESLEASRIVNEHLKLLTGIWKYSGDHVFVWKFILYFWTLFDVEFQAPFPFMLYTVKFILIITAYSYFWISVYIFIYQHLFLELRSKAFAICAE